MGDTSIRVSDETKHRLKLYKRDEESFDDVIMRLTQRDKWAGFGVLSGTETETRNGMDTMREEMRNGMNENVADGE